LIAYFVIRNLLARLDPEAQQKEEARAKASAANRKLGAILSGKRSSSRSGDYDSDDEHDSRRRPRIQDLNLNTYEQTIAMEVVAPEEIPVSFEGTSQRGEDGSIAMLQRGSVHLEVVLIIGRHRWS
jgi:hypothetical protein